MRFDGTLKSWNDERGFGFIEPAQGGQEIFVHIKAFPDGTGRPSVGQVVTFKVELGPNGKKRAHSVQYSVRSRGTPQHEPEYPAQWTFPRLVVIPLFAGLCYYLNTRWPFTLFVILLYAWMSLFTFIVYGMDKAAARKRHWRTPESTLHLLGLVGGWPGALLAQQLLRHKISKPTFVAVHWTTAFINIAALCAWQVLGLGSRWSA